MKARDLLIGAAIGVWLVTVSGHHAPAASSPQPTVSVSSPDTAASAPGPSVSPSPQATSPSPQAASPAISPIPARPGSADWFVVVACAIAIAVSVSTVVFTAREIRLADKRPR